MFIAPPYDRSDFYPLRHNSSHIVTLYTKNLTTNTPVVKPICRILETRQEGMNFSQRRQCEILTYSSLGQS